MKNFPYAILVVIFLSACGNSDEAVPSKRNITEAKPKTNRVVRANKVAQQAAADRLTTMKQITATLRPIRSAEEALSKEAELKKLFDEYARQKEIAAQEGIEGYVLDGLTAGSNRDAYLESRLEFQQYVLLVKQLGAPQREMMNRVMGTAEPDLEPSVEE